MVWNHEVRFFFRPNEARNTTSTPRIPLTSTRYVFPARFRARNHAIHTLKCYRHMRENPFSIVVITAVLDPNRNSSLINEKVKNATRRLFPKLLCLQTTQEIRSMVERCRMLYERRSRFNSTFLIFRHTIRFLTKYEISNKIQLTTQNVRQYYIYSIVKLYHPIITHTYII